MASPLRFRRSTERWTDEKVERDLYAPLDEKFGAEMPTPHYAGPSGYETRRIEMDNGDLALFCWNDDEAFWLGNTETPSALWRTEKYTFEEIPYPVARWAQRELLGDLRTEDPWLADYDHLSWFFLPVLFSKDGRQSSRAFFRDHAAGFPDATRDDALAFYEEFLTTGALDDHRYEMASKLGTSPQVDPVRMASAMSEFTAAKLLTDAGYDVTPEIEVTTGHSLDFRAESPDGGESPLVEVTRPRPPTRRHADTPVAAVRETAETKTSGQLQKHGGGAVLFVDCSGFRDDEWNAVRGEQPGVRHRPAVVFRARPSGEVEAYRKGSVPLDLDGAVEWV
ncbi:DUF5784 family protein [Halorussus gelatinilyticus]|uniref:DUF5784 family protein n=1 Tax=Halorussus gelatinilyticus TaxID=2937524 RepID=A0A8U0ILF9_9EURY|nr:DUF5784 family protein [Halorussus gelatinilyticus]UPW01516.1 DUF5784 family protein [Halorussus gelatinilyticus]